MANSVKAELAESVKKKSFTKIAVVGTSVLLGFILAVSSIVKGNPIFSLVYFIAVIMGIIYILIEINYMRVPCIECDDEKLILTTWENGIFSYRTDFRPQFFADLLPSKRVTHCITLNDISDLVIGTQGFLSKSLTSYELDKNFRELSKSKRMAGYLKRCDILCVRLKDDTVYMMSVRKFDTDKLYAVVDKIEHCVLGLEFKTNLRQLRKKRETI